MISAFVLVMFTNNIHSPPVEAKPTSIVTINWTLCFMLTASEDWTGDGLITPADSSKALFDCTNLGAESTFRNLVGVLQGVPAADVEDPQPEDFVDVDQEGGQLHEKDGSLWIMAFVGNDTPVGFTADQGVFSASGRSDLRCGPEPSPDYDFQEEDCNGDGVKGDGVVVALLEPPVSDRGPATVRVRQGMVEISEPYVITGEPWDINLTAMKPSIQGGAADCVMFEGTEDFLAALGAAEKTPISSTVTDDDGTPLTYAIVTYELDDPDKGITAMPLVPSLATALGVASPNLVCGQEDAGTLIVTATIATGPAPGVEVNPSARVRDAEVEIEVLGPPVDMTLSAAPASLVCDGTATSTISATLTDAEGNPAVDGNVVQFESRALGLVSPREVKSAGGAADTTLTPLSGIARGVVVKATLMLPELEVNDPLDTEDDEAILVPAIEKTILVECAAPAPPAPPAPGPPAPAPPPVIQPPPTGSGGYLP